MKQTIEIEVPEGKIAVWKDNKVVFENIMPKSWEEFCKVSPVRESGEYYIEVDSEIRMVSNYNNPFRKVNTDRNLLPSREAAEAHRALMQLHQLRDYYRQGWEPEDGEESFGMVRFKDGKYGIKCYDYTSTFLSFQTYELAQEFQNNFESLIKQAGDLI